MTETLEKKFTLEDLNTATAYVDRANELMSGRREFEDWWAERVIEALRPYVCKGNVAEMYFGALQRLYKEKTGKGYQPPK